MDRWIDGQIDSYAHTMVANQGLERRKALMSLEASHQLGTWLLKWVPPELNSTGFINLVSRGIQGYLSCEPSPRPTRFLFWMVPSLSAVLLFLANTTSVPGKC